MAQGLAGCDSVDQRKKREVHPSLEECLRRANGENSSDSAGCHPTLSVPRLSNLLCPSRVTQIQRRASPGQGEREDPRAHNTSFS